MRAGALRYWSFTLAGLLLAAAGLVAMNWGLYHLMRTGTCASGGPYEIARPCPDDTGLHIAAVGLGPFVAAVGYGLFVFRGRRGGGRSPIGPGTLMWSLLFVSLAGTAAWAAFGPDATGDEGAEIAALVLLATFVPMAVLPLLGSFFWRRGVRQAEAPETTATYRARIIEPVTQPPSTWQPPVSPTTTTAAPERTLVERMQDLNRLREQGLISVSEFEQQKQRLLGGI